MCHKGEPPPWSRCSKPALRWSTKITPKPGSKVRGWSSFNHETSYLKIQTHTFTPLFMLHFYHAYAYYYRFKPIHFDALHFSRQKGFVWKNNSSEEVKKCVLSVCAFLFTSVVCMNEAICKMVYMYLVWANTAKRRGCGKVEVEETERERDGDWQEKERASPLACSGRTLLWTGRGWAGSPGAEGLNPDAQHGPSPMEWGRRDSGNKTKQMLS